MCLLIQCNKIASFCNSVNKTKPETNDQESGGKPNLGSIIQNIQLKLFKTVKKNREELGNYSKET